MTGVEWACLAAYARTLPPGPVRSRVRALALRGRPTRQGVALSTAAGLGYLYRGKLTPQGEAVARAFLRREGLGL
ncbi:hypothetical protein [Deinococcus sp. YIM 77859]|uniref:hypothetical protein n=1 Tax=Deinococcus sp. YIM 77859 TaxID=1540221 RepID=UPI000554F712|nr:hypothetical protein [Deinococcus sp. YIM 77859]